MPTHSKSRPSHGDSEHKPRPAGGAGGKPAVATGSRNAATGKKLGRAAARGLVKNMEVCDEFLTICERSTRPAADLSAASLSLARVTRTPGNGRVELVLETGEVASLPIAGVLKFRSGAAGKAGNANCMLRGDMVIVRGAQVACKLSDAGAQEAGRHYERIGMATPLGFFTASTESIGRAALLAVPDDGFEFDRSAELAVEAADAAALRTKALRSSSALATVAEEPLDIDAI
jgi:hypothetical protein